MLKLELLDSLGSDLTVVNAARVSFDKHHDVFDEDSDVRLIRYLALHNHWTPFAACQVQVRVTAPIFVARQWFRSNVGVARNETSRRYVDNTPEFFIPETWRSRPEGSMKQGSGDVLDTATQYKAEQTYKNALDACRAAYDALLTWGVAPEQARMVLPQSMLTQWVETGSLAYWARVYGLRVDRHAQQEIRDLAVQLDPIMARLFPISWAALTIFKNH